MISQMQQVAAFVLAGGRSSRMGRDKTALVLDGKTLLQRAVEIAAAAGDRFCIIGAGESITAAAAQLGCPVITDVFAGQGPLAGIHAALESTYAGKLNFILAVDIPFVTPELVGFMVERAAASAALVTLAETAGMLHPLCAVYRPEFGSHARAALAEGRNKIDKAIPAAALNVISQAELLRLGFHPEMLANLNTPADFAAAEVRLRR